jgi:hypothetical protein
LTDPQTEKGIRRLAAQLMLNNTTNIILDTDLAGDVDDVCDVGLMCAFVKLRVIKLLGVVATTPFPWSAPCITTLLDYSVPGHDIAVCQYTGLRRCRSSVSIVKRWCSALRKNAVR